MVTIYEAISLMIAFGMLLIALLAYIDRDNKRIQQKVRIKRTFRLSRIKCLPCYLAVEGRHFRTSLRLTTLCGGCFFYM